MTRSASAQAPSDPASHASGRRVYLAVAGNMGAGKSTLVDFLCRTYGVQPFFEPNEDNPYLGDFYGDMRRWSFHSQVFFLSHKFRIHQELDQTGGVVVQDRTIFEDAEIFATALHRSGRIDERDWQTYLELYRTIITSIRPPDLMIYLRCSMRTLKKRIKLRGREMEQNIPSAYLKTLHDLYEEWIGRYDLSEVLVLETDRMDYLTDLVHRIDVMERIESYLPEGSAHRLSLRPVATLEFLSAKFSKAQLFNGPAPPLRRAARSSLGGSGKGMPKSGFGRCPNTQR